MTAEGNRHYFNKGTECMVIEAFDGSLYVNVLDTLFIMEEMPEHERYSKEFDEKPIKKEKLKKRHIPPMDHPWRRDNFLCFLNKQSHQNGANV